MREAIDPLAVLRQKICRIGTAAATVEPDPVSLGHEAIDAALASGLSRGRLHEIFAVDAADASSAAGFAAMLAQRLGGAIVWLRPEAAGRAGGRLHAPGLRAIGIDPDRMILGGLPDPLGVLRAGLDAVRCPEVGVAVIELWRTPELVDLTATRRLALAAQASGVTPLLLRVAALPAPSAAQTRWAVRAAASAPLAADAPGRPALEVELLRQRGRPGGFAWRVEWDRDQSSFRDIAGDAAASGAVVSVPAGRSAQADAVVPFRRAG